MIIGENGEGFWFQSSARAIETLADHGIYFNSEGGTRFSENEVLFALKQPVCEPFVTIMSGNTIPAFGTMSYTNTPMPPEIRCGRYVQIGQGLKIMGGHHALDRFTTHPVTSDHPNAAVTHRIPVERLGGSVFQTKHVTQKPPPIIANDVWIGDGVTLARGIVIGDGAVIGSGSVVTRDVPPYAIVGGNPARIIRYRFEPEMIATMLRVAWWRYPWPHLAEMNWEDTGQFMVDLEQRVADGRLLEYAPNFVDVYAVISEALMESNSKPFSTVEDDVSYFTLDPA